MRRVFRKEALMPHSKNSRSVWLKHTAPGWTSNFRSWRNGRPKSSWDDSDFWCSNLNVLCCSSQIGKMEGKEGKGGRMEWKEKQRERLDLLSVRCVMSSEQLYVLKVERMSWNTSRGQEAPRGDHGGCWGGGRCCWIAAKPECALVLPLEYWNRLGW